MYDPHKSKKNREKHGIDFDEAQGLWKDPDRLSVPAVSEDEPRYALVARFRKKVWVAFCTERGEKIRLISVRRARKEEEALYEG